MKMIDKMFVGNDFVIDVLKDSVQYIYYEKYGLRYKNTKDI